MTVEEREDLRELLLMEGYRALLKTFDEELAAMKEAVVSYDLGADGARERGLIQVKARAEGAAKLLFNVRSRLDTLRKKA